MYSSLPSFVSFRYICLKGKKRKIIIGKLENQHPLNRFLFSLNLLNPLNILNLLNLLNILNFPKKPLMSGWVSSLTLHFISLLNLRIVVNQFALQVKLEL